MLGAGAWGTALAVSLAARRPVTLWARDAAQAAEMARTRRNPRYLPDVALPPGLAIDADLAASLADSELALVAVPSAALRGVLRSIRGLLGNAAVVWLCKGFEAGSAKLPHQVALEELPPETVTGVLSGPSFAEEVARRLPTALTLAAADGDSRRRIAAELHSPRLRIYASDDMLGVEIAGAVKNVMAIAAGISDGLGLGHNARAALVTRGLAEISRLGVRLGGRVETFMGLAGMGDLILTCTGDLSRNRRVGLQLAGNRPLPEILASLGHVAEGVNSAFEVERLALEADVDMPITRAVCRILSGTESAEAAVAGLLRRDPRARSGL